MTLIVCLPGNDAIVVASDSRAYFKDEKEPTCHDDNNIKIHLIDNVVICGAGTTHAKTFVDEIRNMPVRGVEQIVNEMTRIANEKFDKWFPYFASAAAPNRPPLELSIVGYDVKEPRIYTMNSEYRFAPFPYHDTFALSGVPSYARCLLNLLYSQDMATEALEHLATYVITKTATQTVKVGGPVQMATITPDSGAVKISDERICSIIRENKEIEKRFRDLFEQTRHINHQPRGVKETKGDVVANY